MRVQPLGQEDPLEKETATHSRILAWKIPWGEEPGALQSMRPQSQTQLTEPVHQYGYNKKKIDKLRSVNKDAALLIITN